MTDPGGAARTAPTDEKGGRGRDKDAGMNGFGS